MSISAPLQPKKPPTVARLGLSVPAMAIPYSWFPSSGFIELWLRIASEAWLFSLDASNVMALRTLRLISVGVVAQSEAYRMLIDLASRECINVECRCGRIVQFAPYQLVGRNGVTPATRAWSLRELFRCLKCKRRPPKRIWICDRQRPSFLRLGMSQKCPQADVHLRSTPNV